MPVRFKRIDPDDYESNEDLIYDMMPEWDGWQIPFNEGPGCYLCQTDQHDLCQSSLHLACACFQRDHMEMFE